MILAPKAAAYATVTAQLLAKALGRLLILMLLATPRLASATEPIHLKLSFYGADTSQTYLSGVKPFVDAVNAEGMGLVAIDVYADGTLGKAQAQQPQLVLDGVADIAFITPGVTPYRFPDNVVLEDAGLLRNAREGTLVYNQLIAANELRGYGQYFVIGAYATGPNIIHSRYPINSVADLKGRRIRANNPALASVLEKFGAIPAVIEAPSLANALEKGTIDGAAVSLTAAREFGVTHVTQNHFFLNGGVAPLALVMNRSTFDRLPAEARAIIRKYSGEWAAAAWIESFEESDRNALDKLKADPQRTLADPSQSDIDAAQQVYRSLTVLWAVKGTRNSQLLTTVEAALARVRTGL